MSKKPADSISIAGQIASDRQIGRLMNFIVIDLLMIVFAFLGWVYATECAYSGEFSFRVASRSLDFFPERAKGFWETVGTGVYSFGDYSVPCGDFLSLLLFIVCCVGIFQAVLWLIGYLPVYFRAKRMLRPLNKMAFTATELTRAAHGENVDLGDIESALGSIDPMSSDMHISTGNRDLKGLEQVVNDLLDRMREAYKSQSRFVSDASHELRTPIAVIKGYADMLARWGKSDEKILDESIDAIKKESEGMNKLVEQLLFLARGDNGKQPLTMTRFSLSDMIREVHLEAEMIDPEHEYALEIKDEITVYGDISMIKQTARILCDNAAKYTPPGNRITLRTMLGSGGEGCFEVQDTGIGIAPKDMPMIFDRFFRSDPARSRETGGTGLGLSIAKWIVDRHKGHFEVVSYKDIGTRITVVLPPARSK